MANCYLFFLCYPLWGQKIVAIRITTEWGLWKLDLSCFYPLSGCLWTELIHLAVPRSEAPLWSLRTGFSFIRLIDGISRYVCWDPVSFPWNVFFFFHISFPSPLHPISSLTCMPPWLGQCRSLSFRALAWLCQVVIPQINTCILSANPPGWSREYTRY